MKTSEAIFDATENNLAPPLDLTVVINSKDNDTQAGGESSSGEEKSPKSKFAKRYLGVTLTLIAALLHSLSALTVILLDYHPYNLGTWRFSLMTLLTLPFLVHGHYSKSSGTISDPGDLEKPNLGIISEVWPPTKTTGLLILQAILTSNAFLFVFFSLMYMPMGDSIVISTSSPVFVVFIASLFLGEPLGLLPIFTALLTMVGVGVICKPPILTGTHHWNQDTLRGVIFSALGMLLRTFMLVILRHLRKVHHSLVQFTFALWGLIQSLLLAYFFELLSPPKDISEVGILIASTLCSFGAQTCVTLALKYEEAGLVALVRTMEVLFAYFWQILLLDLQPDLYSFIGATVMLSSVVLATFRKILMSLPENHKKRKTFELLLL